MVRQKSKSIILSMFVLAALSGSVWGVEMVRQELFHDGSTNPPGFRVDVQLMWQAGEAPITLYVKGFMASVDTPSAKTLPIPSRVKAQSDQLGDFLVKQKVTPDEFGKCSIVVPYASLAIPKGKHAVWFQVTLVRDDSPIVSIPTNVINLVIGDQTRQTLHSTKIVHEIHTKSKSVKVFVSEPDLEEGVKAFPMPGQPVPQKLTEKEATETKTYKVSKPVWERRATQIPGGFEIVEPFEQPSADAPADSLQASDLKSLDGPWTTLKKAGDEKDRIVYFATNRTPAAMDWPKKNSFTAKSEEQEDAAPRLAKEVRYGWCRVNIPVKQAKKEKPGFWGQLYQAASPPDPVKDYTIETVKYLDKESFLNGVQEGDILLYVHGFCNQFSDAILRTAQLRYDLDFPGQAIAFCWPSDGELTKAIPLLLQDTKNPDWKEIAKDIGYANAGGSAHASAKQLAEVIELLIRKRADGSQPRIHFIAHSMGNRVLLRAISQLSSQGVLGKNNKLLANVILAAPDVAVFDFYNQVPSALAAAQRTTFYFCDHDSALMISKQINRQDPVGFLPFLMPNLDSIDASAADTSFLAHSYYATSTKVLSDMRLLIKEDAPPQKRMPPLGAKLKFSNRPYWSFDKAGSVNLIATE